MNAAAPAPAESAGPGEFDLIRRYFVRENGPRRAALGIGDDCALLDAGAIAAEGSLAVSTDMLVAGRHFFDDVDPAALGHKALAVNLSDLAAMGARPLGFTLAIALPQADADWLARLAGGMFTLADAHGCELIGGDTTRGPLNLSVTVFGTVPPAAALRRDRARAGDDLWVSGRLGAAAWAVAERQVAGRWIGDDAAIVHARARLEWPQPRVALGLALRGVAGAAIDLSDGLAGDLVHLLDRSSAACGVRLGATLEAAALPVDDVLAAVPPERARAFALGGGDDYELLFTADPTRRDAVRAAGAALGLVLSRIGRIEPIEGVHLIDATGLSTPLNVRSFDHFR
ncbi:MAG: thiamine-phosphate kinase [Burkholderiaceae bacterium]